MTAVLLQVIIMHALMKTETDITSLLDKILTVISVIGVVSSKFLYIISSHQLHTWNHSSGGWVQLT